MVNVVVVVDVVVFYHIYNSVCPASGRLGVRFGVFRPAQEFFTHMETSPRPMKAANFDLCSSPMTIEQ